MTEIPTVEPFPNPWLLALRMSHRIQPALVIESVRIHHQRIAFPMPHGIAHPRWLRINGKLAAVRVYLAVRVALLIQHRDDSRSLNDFERKIVVQVSPRNALRNTACRRTP